MAFGHDPVMSPVDDEDAFALAQSRWEKGVEFALARWLQAWYADNMLGKLERSGKTLPLHSLREELARWNTERRYLPLAGNAESALGDSIGHASRLLLIECKKTLSLAERKREAYGTTYRTDKTKEATKAPNPGGKDRYNTLRTLHGGAADLRQIGESCHILVGMHDFGHPSRPDNEVWRNGELAFTLYWPFIIGNNGEDTGIVKAQPIHAVERLGATLPDFLRYIQALFAQDGEAWDDATYLDREIILMANTGTGAPDWQGGRMTGRQLRKILDNDLIHLANLAAAAAAAQKKPGSSPTNKR